MSRSIELDVPIVLDDIIFYNFDGTTLKTYKRPELDNKPVQDQVFYQRRPITFTHIYGWREYFEKYGEGRELPSLPFMYGILEQMFDKNIRELEDAFSYGANFLCTNTVIDHKKKIVTHIQGGEEFSYRCSLPQETITMDKLVRNKRGRKTLQALFLCKDLEKAVDVFSSFKGRTRVWINNESTITGVYLGIHPLSNRFGLNCYGHPADYGGRCFGIKLRPEDKK